MNICFCFPFLIEKFSQWSTVYSRLPSVRNLPMPSVLKCQVVSFQVHISAGKVSCPCFGFLCRIQYTDSFALLEPKYIFGVYIQLAYKYFWIILLYPWKGKPELLLPSSAINQCHTGLDASSARELSELHSIPRDKFFSLGSQFRTSHLLNFIPSILFLLDRSSDTFCVFRNLKWVRKSCKALTCSTVTSKLNTLLINTLQLIFDTSSLLVDCLI